jgi:Lrp/AsnC family transcriptional regulator for asnA, asnC and gidA
MAPHHTGTSMKIDDTNIAIIQHLRNGRKSYRKIADQLSITENTVRSRVNRMKKEGILEVTGMVDPAALPHHRIVLIGIKVTNLDLVKRGEEFSKLRGVVSVGVVTGRFDLLALVLLRDNFGLLEFYTEEVAKLKGIKAVETFVVYKGFNLKVPYVL